MLINDNLNPVKFVLLIADLLAAMGHINIRITDGPGDGGRDIHSLDINMDRHLTQCKFHKKTTTTCTSSDVSELPMAMIKLGYLKGMFATNSKISPQAKREFLDNYSQLKLDFLDGNLLIQEVSKSAILQALWIEDDRFTKIKNVWNFPFIIRKHNNDSPVLLKHLNDLKQIDIDQLKDHLLLKYPKTIINFDSSSSSSEIFHPYRPPEKANITEGLTLLLYVNEVRISNIEFSKINGFSENLANSLHFLLNEKLGNFSIRFGKPYIIPLEGRNLGSKINLEDQPNSFISTKNSFVNEFDWICVKNNEKWNYESDARTSEADHIRLYNSELDVCLKFEISCKISNEATITNRAIIDKRLMGWNTSVFALVENWGKEWPYTEISEPDDKIVWKWNGRLICGWFNEDLKSDFVRFDNHVDELELTSRHQIHLEKVLRKIKRNKNFEVLTPKQARYMIASLGEDPFFESNKFTYRTAEVIYYPEDLPSPIHPMSRIFSLEFVFEISKLFDKKIEAWMSKSKKIDSNLSYIRRQDQYCFISLTVKNLDIENNSSSKILDDIYIIANDIFLELKKISQDNLLVKTKSYWKNNYGITFDLSWQESELPVIWLDNQPLNNKDVAKDMDLT